MKHRLFSTTIICAIVVINFGGQGVIPARALTTILRVTPLGTTNWPCGDTWTNACSLQTALTNAVDGDEIWVAGGVYNPTTISTGQAATFQLQPNVGVYGGFNGTTDDERADRNPAAHPTILSGDIDSNDMNVDDNFIDETATDILGNNSYHVVTGADNAILDGFIITAGNANEQYCPNGCGAGLYNYPSSPVISNVTFIGNHANYSGGGIYDNSSSPILTYVIFKGNSGGTGGGMANVGGHPSLTNVVFSSNSASGGGGIYNYWSNPVLTNVTFDSNIASIGGGGMENDTGSPTLTNVTFYGNSASTGGGMRNLYNSAILTHVTFYANSASLQGGGLFDFDSSPIIRNTIVWGNTAGYSAPQIFVYGDEGSVVSNCVIQGDYPGGIGIITANPKLGSIGDHGGFTQTIPLFQGSSAIDNANAAYCPSTDQRGVSRPQGTGCDIGAFEGWLILYPIFLPFIGR